MSRIHLDALDDSQYDVLKELGNIGAGNATTALACMLNEKIDILTKEHTAKFGILTIIQICIIGRPRIIWIMKKHSKNRKPKIRQLDFFSVLIVILVIILKIINNFE